MPRLCIKCDSRVQKSLTKPTYYCPKCDEEIKLKDTYKVGKRFFQSETKEARNEKTRVKRKKINGLKAVQRRKDRQKKGR